MRAVPIEKREGEQIYMIDCDCGAEFTTLVFRITHKRECPNCGKVIDRKLLYS